MLAGALLLGFDGKLASPRTCAAKGSNRSEAGPVDTLPIRPEEGGGRFRPNHAVR